MEVKRELILFYGAGAEADYSMPTGLKYRENTILTPTEKNGKSLLGNENTTITSHRLNALKKFYSKYDDSTNHTGSLEGWMTKYEKQKYSATFNIELLRAFVIYLSELQWSQSTIIIAAIKIFQNIIGKDHKIREILNEYFDDIDEYFKKEDSKYIVDKDNNEIIIESNQPSLRRWWLPAIALPVVDR